MKVQIADDALYRDLDGEGVLLDLNSGLYFGLDEVGNRMWQLIVEEGRLDAVRDRLIQEYAADPDQLESDLKRLVEELCRRNLLSKLEEAVAG